jgi:hypothetical protein
MHQLMPFLASQRGDLKFKFELLPSREGLNFCFELKGKDFSQLVWPQANQPGRKDGLWQTTVFELFIGRVGHSSYTEFNFSPSGDWNVYDFSGERQGMREHESFLANPIVCIKHTNTHICVEGLVLPAQLGVGAFELSATAVLDWGQDKEYWALKHCNDKPDFHNRKSFVVKLDL